MSLFFILSMMLVTCFSSCGDFLDQESDYVKNADDSELNNITDTLYSVVGIMNKMQALADRTVLLGELRGDLVDVNSATAADLREISNFSIGDDNVYNNPRDYYAVINNCNYFLAKVDTALRNNRNVYVFRKEYAAVKAFRAWTYLQLAINYGKVPYITEPILTKDDSEKDYEQLDITGICNKLISDIAPYADVETPDYGLVRQTVDSKMFYYPVYVLLGDLNLWAGNYRDAALNYYKYISTRNGTNSAYTISTNRVEWSKDDSRWQMSSDSWSSAFSMNSETTTNTSELITMIPGDSIPAEGNYSELRDLFSSTANNNYQASILPSQSLKNLSRAQIYCKLTSANEIAYAPDNMENSDRVGDLRYSSAYSEMSGGNLVMNGQRVETYVGNSKFTSRNVHILRRANVYLRMAEALNRAGFPRFAFAILKTGVNNEVMESDILPYYPEDAAYLSQFDFPTNLYVVRTRADLTSENTIGIHSRGCGWSEYNEYYVYPETGDESSDIEAVEDLIVDENALETAFEGNRFYDLMRVALRRGDPSYLADKIYARRGADRVSEMRTEIQKDLTKQDNWYLNWNGEIGLGN